MIEQLNELNEKVKKALQLSQSLVQERQSVLARMKEAMALKDDFERKYQERESAFFDMQERVKNHDVIVEELKKTLETRLLQSDQARQSLEQRLAIVLARQEELEAHQEVLKEGLHKAQERVRKVLQNLPTSQVDGK